MADRKCEHCGRKFRARRKTERFCGESCRRAEIHVNPRAVLTRLLSKMRIASPKRPDGLAWKKVDEFVHVLRKGQAGVVDGNTKRWAGKAIWHALWSKEGRRDIRLGPAAQEALGLRPGLTTAKMLADALLTGNIEEPVLARWRNRVTIKVGPDTLDRYGMGPCPSVYEDEAPTEEMRAGVKAFAWLVEQRGRKAEIQPK